MSKTGRPLSSQECEMCVWGRDVWGGGHLHGQQGSGGVPEKRCRLGGPALREEEWPVKLPLERPPKEEPLPLTKLLSLEGNSSASSDVSLWFAANVCKTHTHMAIKSGVQQSRVVHSLLHTHIHHLLGLQ